MNGKIIDVRVSRIGFSDLLQNKSESKDKSEGESENESQLALVAEMAPVSQNKPGRFSMVTDVVTKTM